MNYKTSYILLLTGTGIGLLLALLHVILSYDWIATCGVAIIMLGLIQALVFVRCPDCGRSLLIRGQKPDYCPGCGKPLEW